MIIITGANGFIGSVITWELNKAGHRNLVVVDTVSQQERPAPLRGRHFQKFLHKNELMPFLQTEEAKKSVEWIIHMGANSSTTETNWEHLKENNLEYSQKLFQWCAENRKSLIYASSAATYGAGELGYDDRIDSEKLKPLNLYGDSKVQMDRWAVLQKSTPVHWYGLKFFNVYGPNESHKGSMASVAFKAFHQIRESGELQLFKSYVPEFKHGEQKRDFVYVKDVSAWHLELMQKKPASGIYNMGFGRARSWVDLARSTFKALHQPEKIQFIEMPENIRGQYQYFTEAAMSRWKTIGMSAPRWSLEDGVRDYVQTYLQMKDPQLG